MRKFAVITAGGSGSRMNLSLPKQFVDIAGKPLLLHTIKAFLNYDPTVELVVVLPELFISLWEKICAEHKFTHKHTLAIGGPTRFHSVKSGIKNVPEGVLVAIHDGARPLVSKKTIENTFKFAEKYGNAVAAIEVTDSLRTKDHAISKPLPRHQVRIVQTPQCFNSDLIKEAYNQNFREDFTDDATVLESMGYTIRLVEGNKENIKVTTTEDLVYAEALLKKIEGK